MLLVEVNNHETIDAFHRVPAVMYKNDPNWFPHVTKEVEQIFDRERNRGFTHGNANRWVLFNRNYEAVGRIAAFFDQKHNGNDIGGIGFYECENDEQSAQTLFQCAEAWLKKQGLEGTDGPINFGERHQFWGCRVAGESEPIYQENYNPLYYRQQFQNNGYKQLFESLTFEIDYNSIPFDWVKQRNQQLDQKGFTYSKFNMDEAAKFVEDYLVIASQAFNLEKRIVKVDSDTIIDQLNAQKGALRDDLIWFAYHNSEPVGVFGFMLNWSGIVNDALTMHLKKRPKTIKGFVAAVVPDYQGSGVLIRLLDKFGESLIQDGNISKLYVCGVAGYSDHVQSMLKKYNAELKVKHMTFRKYFDGREFEPLYQP